MKFMLVSVPLLKGCIFALSFGAGPDVCASTCKIHVLIVVQATMKTSKAQRKAAAFPMRKFALKA